MVKMGTVWDRTAEFLTDNLGAVVPVALFAFFVPASIEGSVADLRETGSEQLKLILSLISLAFAVLSVWGTLAITAMALDPARASEASAVAGRRLLPTLLVYIVQLLAVALLFAPIPLALAASGVDLAAFAGGEPPPVAPAVAGLVALYGLALLPVLLWLGARLVLVTAVIVAERRAFGSISRSWRLTRGVVLQVIGVFLLYFLVTVVAILATRMVFGIVFGLIAGRGEGISIAGVLTSVMAAAVQTGFAVLPAAFSAKLYLALVAARETAPAP